MSPFILPVSGVFPAALGDGPAAEVPALDVQAVVARARTGAGAAAVAVRLQGGQVHVGGLRRGRGELHLRARAFPDSVPVLRSTYLVQFFAFG